MDLLIFQVQYSCTSSCKNLRISIKQHFKFIITILRYLFDYIWPLLVIGCASMHLYDNFNFSHSYASARTHILISSITLNLFVLFRIFKSMQILFGPLYVIISSLLHSFRLLSKAFFIFCFIWISFGSRLYIL